MDPLGASQAAALAVDLGAQAQRRKTESASTAVRRGISRRTAGARSRRSLGSLGSLAAVSQRVEAEVAKARRAYAASKQQAARKRSSPKVSNNRVHSSFAVCATIRRTCVRWGTTSAGQVSRGLWQPSRGSRGPRHPRATLRANGCA